MALSNALFSGKFSSDRTIAEYANDIWYIYIINLQGYQTVSSSRAGDGRIKKK